MERNFQRVKEIFKLLCRRECLGISPRSTVPEVFCNMQLDRTYSANIRKHLPSTVLTAWR